jgi:hypothetical protein
MKQLFIISLLALIFTSCQHIYYAPNTPNAPLFDHKGETRINGLYSKGGDTEFEGAELQLAHAFSKNFALMANAFTASRSESVSDYNGGNSQIESGRGSYVEFGGGIFYPLDVRNKWIAELYAGPGFGSVINEYSWKEQSRVGITKLFIQPSIGYKAKNFEIGFIPRVSYINWKVKQENVSPLNNQDNIDELNIIRSDPGFIAFEPSLLLRGGGRGLKAQFSVSFSNFRTSAMFLDNELAETLNASLGISLNLR